MKKSEFISEKAFWNLVDNFENVESLTLKTRKSFKYYVNEMQSKIEDLEDEIERLNKEFADYKARQENDYDPEVEIPQIHGKNISF